MYPYFDVHCHIGMTVSRAPVIGQSVGRCLARMASANVIGAIPCPTAGGPQARGVLDTRSQNDVIANACRKYPERFPIGLGVVEVRHEQAGVDELDRAMCDDGLVGFVCHPALSGHSLGGELYAFLEVVAMHNGLCLLHQAGSTQNIAAYAQRFPTITFIIGHVSMTKGGHLDAIAHCGKHDNIWFDVAQKPAGDESWDLVHLVNNLGNDRIMFGSDLPYYDFRIVQAQIEAADLDDETKERIAYQNAVRLVQQFQPDWLPTLTPITPPQIYSDIEMWDANGARLK
ncbi:MAG: amidohydrolase family protein [Candidatus Poribacteria bacterium]|nr:amidohydrolase family protein [Candidatus Poribacteria bacterium]